MISRVATLITAIITFLPALASAQTTAPADDSRTFRFTYAADITGLPPGHAVRVWVPIPHNQLEQQVKLLTLVLPPQTQPQWGTESTFGNRILSFAATAPATGTLSLSLTYQVTRHAAGAEPPGYSNDPASPAACLQADPLVPAGGPPMSLLADHSLPADSLSLAHTLYDVVDNTLQYRKNQPGWGRGDAVWACNSHFGNCTDFHSLFISLARGCHLPAKFEIGFALPLPAPHGPTGGPIPGYHCWAWFLPTPGGWRPVDIAQANQDPTRRTYLFGHLDPDRLAFTTGRNLLLSPPQSASRLNYFIYPYVEVDQAAYPQEKTKCRFGYVDD